MIPAINEACAGNGYFNHDESRSQERLRAVVEKMKTILAIFAEIEKEYPEFREVARESLLDEVDPARRMPEGMDLETWAKELGAQPLEAFIHEFESLP
jgi:hypothetical protein